MWFQKLTTWSSSYIRRWWSENGIATILCACACVRVWRSWIALSLSRYAGIRGYLRLIVVLYCCAPAMFVRFLDVILVLCEVVCLLWHLGRSDTQVRSSRQNGISQISAHLGTEVVYKHLPSESWWLVFTSNCSIQPLQAIKFLVCLKCKLLYSVVWPHFTTATQT